MKHILTAFLLSIFIVLVFSQDSSESDFPTGFSPDGKIGNVNFIIFGGKLQLSDDRSGYAVSGRLEYLVHESLTIFLGVDYQHLNYNSPNLFLMNSSLNSTFYGGGIKIFGGMK